MEILQSFLKVFQQSICTFQYKCKLNKILNLKTVKEFCTEKFPLKYDIRIMICFLFV